MCWCLQVVVLHIGRAQWMLDGRRFKSQQHIHVPLENLDLHQFTEDGFKQSSSDDAPRYHLCAMVCHEGKGIDEGHYAAYCRAPERDTWLHCDDQRVAISSAQKTQQAQAYLLFFTRSR